MKRKHEGERLTFVFHSANIHYDLLRTGSVELTTNKILERGFLDAVRALVSSYPILLIYALTATRSLFHALSASI